MSDTKTTKFIDPIYIENLENWVIENPTVITLPTDNIPRANQLLKRKSNYLYGKIDHRVIVKFKCGGCFHLIEPRYEPGGPPDFFCITCKWKF